MWTSVWTYFLHFRSVSQTASQLLTCSCSPRSCHNWWHHDCDNFGETSQQMIETGSCQVKREYSLVCSSQLYPGRLLSRMKGKKKLLRIFGFKVCDAPLLTTQSEQHLLIFRFWLAQRNIAVKYNRGCSNLQLSALFLATIRQDC